jgi:phenylalanyl-tRNA synthetase beta chain
MKISELWLREWVKPNISTEQLAEQLTMLGFEVDSVEPVAPKFSSVFVGEVLEVLPHPNADRLHVCKVNIGQGETLSIVCGAQNVRAGMKVPTAIIGAVLPNDFTIKKAALRGVESFGMLCSAVELGLAETSSGLLELPDDAPIGTDIREYLQLDDNVFDINVTANRGDCLSVLGFAREIAAVNDIPFKKLTVPDLHRSSQKFSVSVAKDALPNCPHYVGCIVSNVNNTAKTPIWLSERLRRVGLRSVNPIVDVTNYVMLELGQPLHAFDLAKLDSEIIVRKAKEGEKITLFDGNEFNLNSDSLLIADKSKPLALAGIMGGADSAVAETTSAIFIESAFFTPEKIFGVARNYGLQTDSSYRFERGVDPELQLLALNYCVSLLQKIVGGDAGEITNITSQENIPQRKTIKLRRDRVEKLLGVKIHDKKIISIINNLGLKAQNIAEGWEIIPPSYRFDLEIEEDLIEEIARIYGYNLIEIEPAATKIAVPNRDNLVRNIRKNELINELMMLGYRETMTYSFVDLALQNLLDPANTPLSLTNPISLELAVMRTSLWSGLVKAYLANQSRKRTRVRLFEIGSVFKKNDKGLKEDLHLGGIVSGDLYPLQWGEDRKNAGFYDVKNDLYVLLEKQGYNKENISFNKSEEIAVIHNALHPKRCAVIYLGGLEIGLIGELHPAIKQKLEITTDIILFEINLFFLNNVIEFDFKEISKFPSVERDLSIIVNQNISWQKIKDAVINVGGNLLHEVNVFDVYHGKGIDVDSKSIALHLIFQHDARTLVEQEIEALMQEIIATLESNFGAKLRG